MVLFKDSEVLCVCEDQASLYRLSYFKLPLYDKIPFHKAVFENPNERPLDFRKLN